MPLLVCPISALADSTFMRVSDTLFSRGFPYRADRQVSVLRHQTDQTQEVDVLAEDVGREFTGPRNGYFAQQDFRSYHESGLRTPATTCRIASVTSSG